MAPEDNRGHDERRYSDDEIALILRTAAELQDPGALPPTEARPGTTKGRGPWRGGVGRRSVSAQGTTLEPRDSRAPWDAT